MDVHSAKLRYQTFPGEGNQPSFFLLPYLFFLFIYLFIYFSIIFDFLVLFLFLAFSCLLYSFSFFSFFSLVFDYWVGQARSQNLLSGCPYDFTTIIHIFFTLLFFHISKEHKINTSLQMVFIYKRFSDMFFITQYWRFFFCLHYERRMVNSSFAPNPVMIFSVWFHSYCLIL